MRPSRLSVRVFAAGTILALLTVVVQPAWWPYWLGFVAVFALTLVVDAALAPRLSRLHAELELPAQLGVGAENPITLTLRNRTGRPLVGRARVTVLLDLSDNLAPLPPRTLELPGDDVEVPLALRPLRRGEVVAESLWLAAGGPLGFVRVQRHLRLGQRAPIGPDLPGAARDAGQLLSTGSNLSGARVERHSGDGSEFDHLRDYVPGMDIRTIDWKASARSGDLRCRQFRAERNRQVLVAVDSGRLMGEPLDGADSGLPRLDYAVRAALTLAWVSLQVGDRVGFAAFDDRLRHYAAPLSGRGAIGELGRLAARVEYSTRETNFTLGLMELARRQTRRALIVVMTDFVDSITAELMAENIERLALRHMVVFVALRDPLPDRVAREAPDSFHGLNRAVVAHSLQRDRELVLRRLRRRGIICIDAPPDELAHELVERYLQAKRRERF